MKNNPSYKYRNEKNLNCAALRGISWFSEWYANWSLSRNRFITLKETESIACLEAALCEISSLEQINEAWLDGGKINLHSLIRCNPLGAILTPLKLQKVRALTHACLNVLHLHILNAESPSTGAAYEAPDALICWGNIVSFLLLPALTVPVSCQSSDWDAD